MDKTGRTGSKAQLINGFLLLGAFFGVRIVYGGKVARFLSVSSEVSFSDSTTHVVLRIHPNSGSGKTRNPGGLRLGIRTR